MCVCTHVCMFVCVFVCMHVCVCVWGGGGGGGGEYVCVLADWKERLTGNRKVLPNYFFLPVISKVE